MPGQRFVVVGAGPAGFRGAEVLRQQASDAEITLIGDEAHLPYQRPPLSKAFLTDHLQIPALHLQPEAFFASQRIVLKLGFAATRIDRAGKAVELANGERIAYDKLMLATGCRARKLAAADEGLAISYLRNLSDAEAIRARLRAGVRVVLVGGGFIGLELAASATKLGAQVTVVEALPRLMVRTMPPAIGEFARLLHERHGVRFEFEARLAGIEAEPDGSFAVRTQREGYRADMVVAGIGATPNTELAAAAGLTVEDGIKVDAWGRTSDPDIFAAGDVTRHDNPVLGRAIRVESWQVALNQAAAVARAMLGAPEPYAELPWMWTDQYDCNIQVLGLPDVALELIQRGDPAAGKFTLLGLDAEERICFAITVNNGRDMSALRRLIAAPARVPKAALADASRGLADLAKSATRAG